MEHTPAYALKLVASQYNHERGAKEVEDMGIMQMLELCARQGKTGAEFLKPISDNAIKYLLSLGYAVSRKEDNTEFYVSFENARIYRNAWFSIPSPKTDVSVWARLKQMFLGKSKIG